MHKIFQLFLIAFILFAGASYALAQTSTSTTPSKPVVTFPIAELGNCDSKEACRLYCEVDANKDACLTYAQKVGLMTKEKVATARKIISKKGPGGCNTRESCKAYCEDSSHQAECLSFAQEHKVVSDEKINLIKRFANGEGPGACKSAETCRMYCGDPSHRDECRIFAEENGLMRKVGSSTVERVKAVLASTTPGRERGMELRAIKQGSSTPPNLKERPMSSTTEMKRPVPPLKPEKPRAPTTTNDSLGASILRGFVYLLGF